DPNDLGVLTPGHFLVLEPLSAPPDEDLTRIKLNRLNRWQLIQRCQREFWLRYHAEYLHTLHQKAKWHNSDQGPKIGSIVLIKQENAPVLQWKLGRIIDLHPGTDGIARVATVKTISGQLTRPLSKLCPLPMDDSTN